MVCLVLVDSAVEWSHVGLFNHSGQVCIAGSRTFVQEEIHDEFVKRSVERAKKRSIGDPYDVKTQGGPQVSVCYAQSGSLCHTQPGKFLL